MLLAALVPLVACQGDVLVVEGLLFVTRGIAGEALPNSPPPRDFAIPDNLPGSFLGPSVRAAGGTGGGSRQGCPLQVGFRACSPKFFSGPPKFTPKSGSRSADTL